MQIRDAAFEDCAAVAEIQVNSYRTAYADLLPAEYLAIFSYEEQEQDWKDLLQAKQDLLLVAENDNGLLTGYALARQLSAAECELVALHVRREHHHQGVGRALVAAVARRMQALGCRSLVLTVLEGNPAVRFYERLGGRECGEQFFEIEELNLKRREIRFCWDHIEDLF